MKDISAERRDIEATTDLLEKALKLAGLVSRVFREAGWDLVVVGGSAVEWAEVERLAALPSFNIQKELSALTEEVRRETQAQA